MSMALAWEASLRHCSKKITTNMAVITKSSPSVLMVRTPPNSPPSCDLPDPSDEEGVGCALFRALVPLLPFPPALLLIAPREERAVEEAGDDLEVTFGLDGYTISHVVGEESCSDMDISHDC